MNLLRKVFGRNDEANGWQLILRVITFLGFFTGLMGGVVACVPANQYACYPRCRVVIPVTVPVSVAPNVTVPPVLKVDVYGDSRGWFLAEGARFVSGWDVTNYSRQGCTFLGQDHIWKRYSAIYGPDERNDAEQTTGETVLCDTRTYIHNTNPLADIAIIYAGTLFAVDGGMDENVHSPTEPEWAQHLEDNLVETLLRIPTRRTIILSTPVSSYGLHEWGTMDDLLWARQDRLDAVDAILGRAAARVNAVYLSGFADWVESQPTSCQSDGSHFTLECAQKAGEWIQGQDLTMTTP